MIFWSETIYFLPDNFAKHQELSLAGAYVFKLHISVHTDFPLLTSRTDKHFAALQKLKKFGAHFLTLWHLKYFNNTDKITHLLNIIFYLYPSGREILWQILSWTSDPLHYLTKYAKLQNSINLLHNTWTNITLKKINK